MNGLSNTNPMLFTLTRSFILGDSGHKIDGVERPNPKGGKARGFDLHVEKLIRDYFESKGPGCNLRIISEEQPSPMLIGKPPYSYTLIVDPVDGSDNHIHGIQSVAFAVAVVHGHLRVSLNNVIYAFVGDIYTGNVYRAERGKGTFWNNQKLPLYNKGKTKLEEYFVTVNFDRDDLGNVENNARCLSLFKVALGNRRCGSACLDICELSKGSIGAYIDLRRELSPENFLAPALILSESGCVVTDKDGKDIGHCDFSDLSRRYSIICARSNSLADEVVALIQESE